jgi:hypothetical protein
MPAQVTEFLKISGRIPGVVNEMDLVTEQFAGMFKDEGELRKAIASMLRKIEGVTGVEITHGTREHGKDIIFYKAGGLGEIRLFACVVKNEKITGSVNSSHGAKTVLSQAEQAFEEPYINGDGDTERVDHVYIMSPYECSQATMDSIDGRLSQRPVTFSCGGKLLDLFQRNWPEFLIFNSSLLSSYVANLKRGLDEDNPLKYLSGRHSILANAIESFSNVYVKQDFYQTFQEYKLDVDIPNLLELLKPISMARSSEIQFLLRRLASFVRASEVWSSRLNDSARQQFENYLIHSAKQLKSCWDKGYEEHAREKSSLAQAVPSRRDAVVQIADHQSVIGPYSSAETTVREMADELSEIVKSGNAFVCSQPHTLNDLMKSPRFLDYCVVVEASRRIPESLVPELPSTKVEVAEELLRDASSAVLIVGPPGYGKSSYCKWNVTADLERLAGDKTASLPIYVPLHQISREAQKSPQETFLRSSELRELLYDPRYNQAIASIRLYLDGLDEVPSAERQQELVTSARELLKSDKRFSMILTAREHVGGWWLNWMPRVRIREFSEEQSKELISKWIEDEPQRSDFYSQLGSSATLRPLLQVPLLATLIVAVFRNLRRLPENRIRLYEMFMELMFGGWDLAKNVKREIKFGSVMKLSLLSRLAFYLHLNKKRDCVDGDIRTVMKDVMPMGVEKFPELAQELVEDGLLLKQGSAYYFAHLSFQEYLAAKDLADPTGRRQTDVLRWYLAGNDWWREVLLFYIAMQAPQDVENWIKKTVDRMIIPSTQVAARINHEFHFLMEYFVLTFPDYRPRTFQIGPPKIKSLKDGALALRKG